jgi:3D (Asp-Asp-Asp) domain-containing protein
MFPTSPTNPASRRRRRPSEPAGLRLLTVALLAGMGLTLAFAGCATAAIRPVRGRHQAPRQVSMSVTGYCNCGTCCSWRYTWYGRRVYTSGPNKGKTKALGVTASGSRARRGTVAADTRRYPMGTIVYVPGYGYGRVEDTGGAIKDDVLDLWFPSHEQAGRWGRRQLAVQVWLPK